MWRQISPALEAASATPATVFSGGHGWWHWCDVEHFGEASPGSRCAGGTAMSSSMSVCLMMSCVGAAQLCSGCWSATGRSSCEAVKPPPCIIDWSDQVARAKEDLARVVMVTLIGDELLAAV